MTLKKKWEGVFPAALTHFKEDYSIDIDSTMNHVNALVEQGVHGMVTLGTCGENNSLEPDEKIDILRETLKTVQARVPVLTGVSELTTSRAVRFTKEAEKLGVDGLMVLPAMAYKADPRETITHFKSIAKNTGLPVMIYNNPVNYHVDVTVDMLIQLGEIDNIVAVKESSNDVRRITDIITSCADRYILFCGVDDLAFESFLLGATGWISGLVNAFPRENILLWDLLKEGRLEEAREIYRWYTPSLHLDTKVKLVQYIKLAAKECGFGSERVRPPRLELKKDEREKILNIIQSAIKTRPTTQITK